MGLFSKIKLNDILKVASLLVPLAPVIVHAGKSVIQSKGKTAPDVATTGIEIAKALGTHSDRLDEIETIIKGTQSAGVLPTSAATSQ